MMTKYSFFWILLAVFVVSCEREISSEQSDSFVKFYGNYLMDEAGDVEVLANGGYAICGTETSGSGDKRMVLIITDPFGNVRNGFPKYYTEEGLDAGGTSLIALEGGSDGFFISGYVEKPVAGSQDVQKDIFLVRTSASGDTTWQRSYGSAKDEYILHAIKKIGSGYLLAGYRGVEGATDLMVMGVTEEGDSIKLGLNYNNPYARSSAANYLLNTGDMYLCACTFDQVNGEGTAIQILTFDDELSPLAKNLSGEYDEQGMCILEERDGAFLVLGNRLNTSGGSDMVLYGIETDGLLITGSSLLTTISDDQAALSGRKVIESSSGKLVILGTREVNSNPEILMQFVSASHQSEELLTFGAAGAQTGTDIELSRDGGYVLLGTNSDGVNRMISLLKTNAAGDI
jgi:hypothetical protein